MRFGSIAVTEQIDTDHLEAGVVERAVNPLRCHVEANEPPQPWTSTTGTEEVVIEPTGYAVACSGQNGSATALAVYHDRIGFTMKLLHPDAGYDLTYNDVFMVPSQSDGASR